MSIYNKRINKTSQTIPASDWNKVTNIADAYTADKRSVTNSTPDSSSGVVSDDHCHTVLSDYADTISSTTQNNYISHHATFSKTSMHQNIQHKALIHQPNIQSSPDAPKISINKSDVSSNTENKITSLDQTNYPKWHCRRLSMTPSPSLKPRNDGQTNFKQNSFVKPESSNVIKKPPTSTRCHENVPSKTSKTEDNIFKADIVYQNISDFHQNLVQKDENELKGKNQQPVFIKSEGRLKKQIKSLFHPTSKANVTNFSLKNSYTMFEDSQSKSVIQTFHNKSRKKISFSPETASYNREDKLDNNLQIQTNKLCINRLNTSLIGYQHFNCLQDHLITAIFQYLPSNELCKCAMVCKKWYHLVWSPALWSNICIHHPKLDMDKALKCMTTALSCDASRVCLIVESIDLTGSRKLTDKGLFIVAHRCPELRRLIIDNCSEVTNIAIFEIVSRCINLELLSLSGCQYVNCISLTPEANLQASLNNKQIYLNHLDMTDCINVDDSSLQMIVTYCSQLTYLYLRRCVKITDLGVQYVASYCNKLKELSVSDCPNVSDLSMRDISRLESNLRYLSVAKCKLITDIGLKCVAKKCLKIRYFNLRGCERITEEGIIFLAAYLSKLRSLDLGNCNDAMTDRSIAMIADGCQQLKRVSLKGCTRLSDEGLTRFAQKLPQLQQINLVDCKVTHTTFNALHRYCDDCIVEHNNPGVSL